MPYGICLFSCIPARKEPGHSSEMVTQLLFGEHYTVLEQNDTWVKITTAFDRYTCWIHLKQHGPLSEANFRQLEKLPAIYSNDLVHTMYNKLNQLHFPITIGSTLPFFKHEKISFDSFLFEYDGQITHGDKKAPVKEIISTAFLFLNTPYLWGGKSPFGMDCSGFTQMVYKLNGYKLPRDANQQVELGTPLSFVDEAEAGDLAFFDNEEGKIVHVGLLLNKQEIIHASGSVRIDPFDHYGIFNKESKKYSHLLRVIKRIC